MAVTRVHLSNDAQLLTAYSPTKRTLVVWDLSTGKLKSAFSVDAVAHGRALSTHQSPPSELPP